MRNALGSFFLLTTIAASCATTKGSAPALNDGFTPLFNGRDLAGWKIPEGDNGHWKVVDNVIDYDARSESSGQKDLWSEKEYGDFVLRLDWRLKEYSGLRKNTPVVLPDGSHQLDAEGKEVLTEFFDSDSGIYIRGTSKAQINMWCWPIGSGEVYGYRTDKTQPADIRAGVTPKMKADKPIGEWNNFELTVKGDRVTVVLNGQTVLDNAQLPALPPRGPLALQHHGGFKDGKYLPSSSLVQFRNIAIKEM